MSKLEQELAVLKAMSDEDIDTSDIPDSSQLNWDKAEMGKFYRENITKLAIDDDIAQWFASHNIEINQVLRQYILQHQNAYKQQLNGF